MQYFASSNAFEHYRTPLSACLKILVAFSPILNFCYACFEHFFCLCFLSFAYLDLRCTTHDAVLVAIEITKNNFPQANFNPLTNKGGITLPMENPPSGTAVSYSDSEVKQNDASLDCLLRNAREGNYIKYLLQPTRKKYVTTDWTLNMCVYEAIVSSLYSTLSKDEHMLKNYTGLDLKN